MPDAQIADSTAAVPAPPVAVDEGWPTVLRDAFPKNPHGVVPVTWSLVRAPFATIFRLVDDVDYRSYWGLLLTLTGATVIALFITLPQLFNRMVGQEIISVASEAQRLRLQSQLVQVASILFAAPIQYYACRWLSPITRAPRPYVKLIVLGVCYSFLIRIAFGVVAMLAGLVILSTRLPVMPSTVIGIEFAAALLASVAFSFELHRRFWRIAWWKLVLMFLVFLVLSQAVLVPFLAQVFNALGQAETPFLPTRQRA